MEIFEILLRYPIFLMVKINLAVDDLIIKILSHAHPAEMTLFCHQFIGTVIFFFYT